MGEIPETTNATLDAVESIISGSVMQIGVPVVVQSISSIPALSWLKIWPLSSLLNWAVSWVANKFSIAFQNLSVTLVINIQTDAERSQYAAAEQALRKAHLSGDENELKKASDNFDKALQSLVRWDGSAPVR